MAAFRESVSAELLKRYSKDKISEYLTKTKKNIPSVDEVESFHKENAKNYDAMKKIMDYIILEYSDSYDSSLFRDMMFNDRNKKGFRIVSIEKISTNLITSYSIGVSLRKKAGKTKEKFVGVSDSTGVFKVNFPDGEFMYYAKWISGGGKSRSTEGMYAAEKKVWYKFLNLMGVETKKRQKPKNGIFKISATQNGISYNKLDKLQDTPVVHPSINTLEKDMDYYFDNLKLFTRFGMSGVRKTILVGPPGTGKTSLSIKLSKKFKKSKSVVFATGIGEVAEHLIACAKAKVSTLIILEDAEMTLQNANSELLNFLDGINLPQNEKGAYIILTTNHPERIESRIYKRPGRIDKIIHFGTLTEKYAIQCANIYFEDILFDKKSGVNTAKGIKMREDLYPVVNNSTGAEIKELAQATASYAASQTIKVTVDVVKTVRSLMKSDLTDIMKYAEESSSMSKRKTIGLSNNESDAPFDKGFLMPAEK